MSGEGEYKDTPIGRIPKEWEVVPLEFLCQKTINGGTPSTKIQQYWVGNIPWITGADIVDQSVKCVRRFITEEAVQNSATHIVPKGGLLIVSRTGVGKIAIAPFDIAISQDITGFIPNNSTQTSYVFWSLINLQNRLETKVQGTSINGILRQQLMSQLIPLPPLPEQHKIAAILSTVDDAIAATDEVIANVEQLKKGLMQELLTKGIGHTEFKDTPIGRIPKEWDIVALGKCSEEVTVGFVGTMSNHFVDIGIPLLRGQNVLPGELDLNNLKYIDSDFHKKLVKSQLKPGDVIVVRVGNPGTACVVPNSLGEINCASVVIIRTNKPQLEPNYLVSLLNSSWFRSKIKSMIVGNAQQVFNVEFAEKLTIPLPSAKEQQEILNFAVKLDKMLSNERNYRLKLQNLKKGLMQVLLTGEKRVKVDQEAVTNA